ncbi:MAG: hypothetical protein IT580_17405 [Verrucomicrobiales bacterium]|nr:hypothetical protein [Verrucomicrobiales bacterium]
MTLQRFLNAAGDSRWLWFGRGSWKPAPSAAISPGTFLLQVIGTAILACVPGGVLALILQRTPQFKGGLWPLPEFAALGFIIGLVVFLLVTVAWNRRAARLRAAGLTSPPALPPSAWWQRWLVAPLYVLVLFLVTPLAAALALDNALGTAAWNRYRTQLLARGERLTFAELESASPPDAENFARTPLLRPMSEFSIVVTNQRSELVWKDPIGRLRLQALTHLPFRNEGSPDPLGTNTGRMALDPYARGIRSEPFRLEESVVLATRSQLGLPTNVPPAAPDFVPLPRDLALRYGLLDTNRTRLSTEESKALVITNAAAEVLAFLKRLEPELQEIAEASHRPRSRFTAGWNESLSPTARVDIALSAYARVKGLTSLFRVRAAARLEQGDAAGALADTRTLFRLSQSMAEDPTLMGLLVRIAQDAIAMSMLKEGIAARQWTDAQLAECQALVRAIDRRESLIHAFRGERALGLEMLESWIRPSSPFELTLVPPTHGSEANLSGIESPTRSGFFQPRGMYRRWQIAQSQLVDHLIADLQDPTWPQRLTQQESTEAFLHRAGLLPATRHTILAIQLAPALDRAAGKAARINTTARLAEIACALERHRLRHGQFPETLDVLAPTFLDRLPADPMTGKPFLYRRTEDGWFKLWSVGLNGRDDGGTMKRRDNDQHGDWVWPVPVPISKEETRLL